MTLEALAPRLGLAYRQRRVELARERAARRRSLREIESLERMVAHRELQLVRAQATGRGRYIDIRQAKLDDGRRRLQAARARAEALRR